MPFSMRSCQVDAAPTSLAVLDPLSASMVWSDSRVADRVGYWPTGPTSPQPTGLTAPDRIRTTITQLADQLALRAPLRPHMRAPVRVERACLQAPSCLRRIMARRH